MNRARIATLTLLFVFSLVALPHTVSVSATRPIEMEIRISWSPPIMEPGYPKLLPNGFQMVKFTSIQEYSGDWDGDVVQVIKGIVRPDGSGTADGFGTFTGTVHFPDGDKSGSIYYRIRNSWSSEKPIYAAIYTILKGTGELENIHGHGTLGLGVDPGTGALSVKVHLDP